MASAMFSYASSYRMISPARASANVGPRPRSSGRLSARPRPGDRARLRTGRGRRASGSAACSRSDRRRGVTARMRRWEISGCGSSSRMSEAGSTAGPSSARSRPFARWAAGERARRARGTSPTRARARTRVRELVGGLDATHLLRGEHQQTVVQVHEEPPAARRGARRRAAHCPLRDRQRRRARPREGTGSCSRDERSLQDALRLDPVCEIDDLDLGAIRFMTPWQVPTRSSSSPKSVRNVIGCISATLTDRRRRRGRRGHASPPRPRLGGRPLGRPWSSVARS